MIVPGSLVQLLECAPAWAAFDGARFVSYRESIRKDELTVVLTAPVVTNDTRYVYALTQGEACWMLLYSSTFLKDSDYAVW